MLIKAGFDSARPSERTPASALNGRKILDEYALHFATPKSAIGGPPACDRQSAGARCLRHSAGSEQHRGVCGTNVAIFRGLSVQNSCSAVPGTECASDRPNARQPNGRVRPQPFALNYEAPECSWCSTNTVGRLTLQCQD